MDDCPLCGNSDTEIITVDIAKHRRGATGKIRLNYFRDIARFEDRGEQIPE